MESKAKRDRWDSKSQFLLVCVGYAVGLGNIWRFPYLCFKSGGGAFMIPYLTMLILCGIPLLYLEMAVGQYTGFGPVRSFAILCPLMKGVGVATVVISFVLCTYYNVIISWALYYLFNSFRAVLPWQGCNHTWNSPACAEGSNATGNYSGDAVSATQDFFDRVVLGKTKSISDMGNMQWEIFDCFVLAWILVYVCVFKGIKSAGKVVYVTATFPYVILIVLLIASVQLPGAIKGIVYFVKPEWSELLKVQVWVNAAAQNFNSIGISFGSLIAFASYNPRSNNILRDTLCISCINSATSLLAVAKEWVNTSHTTNTFTNTNLLLYICHRRAKAFLWLLGLGSVVASQYSTLIIRTSPTDLLKYRFFSSSAQGGIYVFTLMDSYTAIVSLMFLAFFEMLALCWLYGGARLARNVKNMTGQSPPRFFVLCWLFIAPILIGVILICSIIQYKPATYGTYKYPEWADAIGWLIALSSMICIPIGAVCTIYKSQGTIFEIVKASIQPRFNQIRGEEADEKYLSTSSSPMI